MIKLKKIKCLLLIVLSVSCLCVISKDNFENISIPESMLRLGIEKSDIELVKKALYKFDLTSKDKERFVALAEERVKFRKDMLKLAILGKFSGEEKPGTYNLKIGAILSGLFFCTLFAYSAYKRSVSGAIISFWGYVLSALELNSKDIQGYKDFYKDAIHIREIIFKA